MTVVARPLVACRLLVLVSMHIYRTPFFVYLQTTSNYMSARMLKSFNNVTTKYVQNARSVPMSLPYVSALFLFRRTLWQLEFSCTICSTTLSGGEQLVFANLLQVSVFTWLFSRASDLRCMAVRRTWSLANASCTFYSPCWKPSAVIVMATVSAPPW